MPRTLWLVRHGESLSNAGGLSLPHDTIPLTAKGVAQAVSVAAMLPKPARVIVSGLQRTADTAAPYLARHGVIAVSDARLNEFNMLSFDAIRDLDGTGRKQLSDLYWAAPCPQYRHGADADTFGEFAARVDAFIADMADLPEATVIFGHGTWLSLLCWRLVGAAATTPADMQAFRDFNQRQPVKNAEILSVRAVPPGGWQVKRGAVVS